MKKLLSILVFVMFFQLLISFVYASYPTLSDYPDFLLPNLYIVYGEEGSVSNVVAGTNIVTNINSEHPEANIETKMDSEILNPYSTYRNFLLIGSPCYNELTARIMKKTYPACGQESGIPEDSAIIKIFDDGFQDGYDVLVVAGWDDSYTTMAASVLQKHKELLSDKDVKAVKVTSVSSSGITSWLEEETTTIKETTTTTIKSDKTTTSSTTTNIGTTTIFPTTSTVSQTPFFDSSPSFSDSFPLVDIVGFIVVIIVIISVGLYLYKRGRKKTTDQMDLKSLTNENIQ